MQCVTPMFFEYYLGDKKHGKIIPREQALHEIKQDPFLLVKIDENNKDYRGTKKIIPVPCKKCTACRLNYSAEWATRIMNEVEQSEYNFWITLTYDDKHLPIAEKTEWDQYDPDPKDPHAGKIKTHQVRENDGTWGGTLNRSDIDRFINSLRKYMERKHKIKFKFYYCGEYGSETHRPHFHICLMNCPLDIKEFYGTHIDKNFKAHWKSREVEAFWSEPCEGNTPWKDRIKLGMVDICELEWSDAAYTARYCTKKIGDTWGKEEYLEIGKLPEYVSMSNGIGFNYYKKNKDRIYKTDEMIMRTVKGNVGSFKPPKAYDRIFKEENPKAFRMIQLSRQHAGERRRALENSITDLPDFDKLIRKAENVATKLAMLPRPGEWATE